MNPLLAPHLDNPPELVNLVKAGFSALSGEETLPLDGVYDDLLAEETRRWQAAHRLPESGAVDEPTYAGLRLALDKKLGGRALDSLSPPELRFIQAVLISEGFVLTLSGLLDDATHSAVKAYFGKQETLPPQNAFPALGAAMQRALEQAKRALASLPPLRLE